VVGSTVGADVTGAGVVGSTGGADVTGAGVVGAAPRVGAMADCDTVGWGFGRFRLFLLGLVFDVFDAGLPAAETTGAEGAFVTTAAGEPPAVTEIPFRQPAAVPMMKEAPTMI
jgi:hypothetical protein